MYGGLQDAELVLQGASNWKTIVEQKIDITAYTQSYKINFGTRMKFFVPYYISDYNNHPVLK